MRGLRCSNSKFGGIVEFCRANEVLSRPARPAVPSVCPMIVLILPTKRGTAVVIMIALSDLSLLPLLPKKAVSIASASMGSPAGVPVPWASKY